MSARQVKAPGAERVLRFGLKRGVEPPSMRRGVLIESALSLV